MGTVKGKTTKSATAKKPSSKTDKQKKAEAEQKRKAALEKKAEEEAKAKEAEYQAKLADVLGSKEFQKEIKDGTIIVGQDEIDEGDVVPFVTRFPSLNLSIGIGGIPKGKVVEISGLEGGFKSSVCWAIAGDVQRAGGIVAWVDAEQAVDLRIPKFRRYLASLGVDYTKVIIVHPDTAEKAFKIVEVLAVNPNVQFIVFDSIVALSNQREADAEMEKTDRNTLAMTINKGLRKVTSKLRQTDCTLFLINQLRVNQNKVNKYDKDYQTTGGQGLKHWCSLRLESKTYNIKNADKQVIGKKVIIKVVKTRFDFFRDDAVIYYYNASGFSPAEEVIEMAIAWGILEQVKQSYVFDDDGEELKMTRVKWLETLEEDLAGEKELYNKVLSAVEEAYEDYYAPDSDAVSDVEAEMEDGDDDEEEE